MRMVFWIEGLSRAQYRTAVLSSRCQKLHTKQTKKWCLDKDKVHGYDNSWIAPPQPAITLPTLVLYSKA
jgi:hypothetical protein